MQTKLSFAQSFLLIHAPSPLTYSTYSPRGATWRNETNPDRRIVSSDRTVLTPAENILESQISLTLVTRSLELSEALGLKCVIAQY